MNITKKEAKNLKATLVQAIDNCITYNLLQYATDETDEEEPSKLDKIIKMLRKHPWAQDKAYKDIRDMIELVQNAQNLSGNPAPKTGRGQKPKNTAAPNPAPAAAAGAVAVGHNPAAATAATAQTGQ